MTKDSDDENAKQDEASAKKAKKVSRRKFLVRGGLGTIGVLAIGTYVPVSYTHLTLPTKA